MSEETLIRVENLSKRYRLGLVGTGTLASDISRLWHRVRGKEDPFSKVGKANFNDIGHDGFVWSLRDVSFEVKKGEALGIIGKNGAGKSTLLKILSQITTPTAGSARIKGRIASLLEVGTGFHPELTGRENIFLNGAILGMSKLEIAGKLDEIIAFSGVEHYIDTPVKRYSSGMYVRLAFAVAAHLEPEILIVDEVLAVGDADFQKKCLNKMKAVTGDGRTVLFVSHNMAAVKNLCTKGIVLEKGQMVFSGSNEDAIHHYTRAGNELMHTPFHEREDRKGNGKLRLKNILFFNQQNKMVTELTSGEHYKIRFGFERFLEINPAQLTLVLQFKNESDEVVCTIATDEQGTQFQNPGKSGYFEIDIPRLIFREGRYSLNFMISEKASFNTQHEIIDYLSDAVAMTVQRGDYWKSGVLNRPKGFIQDSSIRIINAD